MYLVAAHRSFLRYHPCTITYVLQMANRLSIQKYFKTFSHKKLNYILTFFIVNDKPSDFIFLKDTGIIEKNSIVVSYIVK